MKRIQYILYGIVLVLIIVILAADYMPDKSIEPSSLTEAGLLTLSVILGMSRAGRRSERSVRRNKAVYAKAYATYIHDAFAEEPKLERQLYKAIDAFNRSEPAAALKILEALREDCRTTNDRYAVTFFSALCLDELGMYQRAETEYRAALLMRPDSAIASNLGLVQDRLGKTDEARDSFSCAIRLDPKNANAHNNLAQQSMRLGDYAAGLAHAKAAIAINDKLPQALNAMCVCSYMLGNREDYETYYHRAVACGSNGQRIKDYIRSLDSSLS